MNAAKISVKLKTRRILVVLVAAAIAVGLHLADFQLSSKAARDMLNAAHAPGFGLIGVILLVFFRKSSGPLLAYGWAFLIALTIGILSEAFQFIGPRDADLGDLGRDAIGIAGFLAIAASVDPLVRQRLSRISLVAVLLFLGIIASIKAVTPFAGHAHVLLKRHAAVPVIMSFDHNWETEFYRSLDRAHLSTMTPPESWPVKDGLILEIKLVPAKYSGIVIEPFWDWSEYESLSFLAASADGLDYDIVVRIHDAAHNQQYEDRFNRTISVGPTAKRYRIFLSDIVESVVYRRFDLSNIAGMVVFKVDAKGDEKILIDDLRLE